MAENYTRTNDGLAGGFPATPNRTDTTQRERDLSRDSSTANGGESTAMEKGHQLQEVATEKVGEVGTKLQDTADKGVNRAAEGIDQASTQLRDRATEMGGVQEKVGLRLADGLDKTSVYLRDHESQEIWNDVEKFVREHPMQAAVTAAVAGYVVAKVLR